MKIDLTDAFASHVCGREGRRHTTEEYIIQDFGKAFILRACKYFCRHCGKYFIHPGRREIAPDGVAWSHRVVHCAIALRRNGVTLENVASALNRKKVSKPLWPSTIYEWCLRLKELYNPDEDASLLSKYLHRVDPRSIKEKRNGA